MSTLTTNRNHMIAARFYALAADARRSALENGADPELAAIQADQARVMKARAIAARNGAICTALGAIAITMVATLVAH